MSTESERPANMRPASPVESFSVLIARVLASENLDLHRCMAADLNAFLMSLSLLSKRREIIPDDIRLLFERFQLTLQAAPPSQRGQSDYAPQGRGTQMPPLPDRARLAGTTGLENEFPQNRQ